MGFRQIDAQTVADDEGNTYFAPFLNYDPNKLPDVGVPSAELGASPDGLPSMADLRPPIPQTLPSSPESSSTVKPTEDFVVMPPEDVSTGPNAAKLKDAKARAEIGRQKAMTDDVAAFSLQGGVAKSDEDMARILGGQAAHKVETAKAESNAAKIAKEGEISKTKKMAEAILETATDYEKYVASVQQDAKKRWDDWKKRNDQAAAQLVDPRRAVSNQSTLSKVGWALAFLGAGMQGGAQVQGVTAALNKIIEDDIAAQRSGIENKRQGLQDEKSALKEQDQLNKDAIADWYAAKELRLKAVGKQLDAKIAEMGLPAAEAAGLLKARDAIEEEVVKGQAKIAEHFNTKAQKEADRAHDVYMERLKHKLRMEEEREKAGIKKGEQRDTLPTNTKLGLQMVDRRTGKKLDGGVIPLKVKGDKAIEAGQILSNSNEEASELQDIQKMLLTMSSIDLARGGTPEFKSAVKNAIQNRARRDNGARLSDKDIPNAARAEFGVEMDDSLAKNTADAIRMVGPYKEGVQKAIARHQRNLANKTVNKLQPYIDSEVAQTYDIVYNPQDTNVEELSQTPDDLNTELTKAAEGADVSDLRAPGPRPPRQEGDLRMPMPPYMEAGIYELEKKKGRGLGGGLPDIDEKEAKKVEAFSTAVSTATVDDILKLTQSYLRRPGLSEEAKHEIRQEAQLALQEAKQKEAAVLEEAKKEYMGDWKADAAGYTPITENKIIRQANGEYTEDFKKYLESGVVDEMRKRAGLVPRRK